MLEKKIISIHLNSNKPHSFEKFVSSIILNTDKIETIEILVNIDKHDDKMKSLIKNINSEYYNLVRYIETDLIKTFADAWKPLNMLLKETSKTVEFVSCMSDDIRFVTKKWDKIIKAYTKSYDDKIVRIRCSKYKGENYKDIWECGYKPDSYSFYSKKWLEAVGQWNPCIGPDSFQECVAYYLRSYGKKYNREIVDEEINFTGQEVSTNLPFKKRIERTRIYYKAFFILMSYKNQRLANNFAYNIVKIISKNNHTEQKILSRCKIYVANFTRRFNFFYYRGSPNHIINTRMKNLIFILWIYLKFTDRYIIIFLKYLEKKKYLKYFIKDQKKLEKARKIINYEKSS
tara:strand:+ start:308 stop:1342 length:1035 start_codon:yes stop_codon:yes gene_type:complete